MRPLDPRLLRHARAARGHVAVTAALGVLTAVLVVVQALLLADAIATVAVEGGGWPEIRDETALLVAVLVGRAGISWAQERFGHRAATAVIGQLRLQVVEHVSALGRAAPGEAGVLDGTGAGSLVTLVTRGLDALDGYLVRYLPQLLLAVTVTPGVLVVVAWQDGVSAVIIAVTLPLVPVFMVLVGLATRSAADRRLRTMRRLGTQVLDLVAGLPTATRPRPTGPRRRGPRGGDAYRRATMGTLRSAFLSALVLETLTTISVALVAVVGLRLVHGGIDLRTGLAVLVLAPEVYLPLRMVGLHYHASVDGLAAAAEAFTVLDREPAPTGRREAPDLRGHLIVLDDVSVTHRGRTAPTPHLLRMDVRPGRVHALTGPSGSGKSTACSVLLGLRRPDAGRVLLRRPDETTASSDGSLTPGHPDVDLTDVDLADLDPASWWRQVSWVPQRPPLVPGSLLDNVLLAAPEDATRAEVDTAAAETGLAEVVAALATGWDTPVGQGGVGLSAGQRQRVALTRALLSRAQLVILDEPTAHLDAATEGIVRATLLRLRDQGRTVVVVAHRASLVELADDVTTLGPVGDADPAAGDAAQPSAGVASRATAGPGRPR